MVPPQWLSTDQTGSTREQHKDDPARDTEQTSQPKQLDCPWLSMDLGHTHMCSADVVCMGTIGRGGNVCPARTGQISPWGIGTCPIWQSCLVKIATVGQFCAKLGKDQGHNPILAHSVVAFPHMVYGYWPTPKPETCLSLHLLSVSVFFRSSFFLVIPLYSI